MNVQAAPSTYTPAGGDMAQPGLTALANPMAQQLQSYGRDEDTMLIHMTPGEVNSLQGLAMAAGGSLTVNPITGLPEASFLKKLLPILLGVGLNFAIPGLGLAVKGLSTAAQSGLMVGAGQTALTGNLGKGLEAGLSAFGGASFAGGVQGAFGGASKALLPAGGPIPPAPVGATNVAEAFSNFPGVTSGAVKTGLPGFGQGFANTAKGTMTGLAGKAAVPMAGAGVLSGISDATTPGFRIPQGQIDNSYQGPYTAQRRTPQFADSTDELLNSSAERRYFDVAQPEIYNMQGQVVQPGSNTAPGTLIRQAVLNPNARKNKPMYSFRDVPFMGGMREEEDPMSLMPTRRMGMDTMMGGGFAKGGEVQLADGAFVIDARTVSEIGNGSSNAGMEALSRMGGQPLDGPGDGVSDSIPARIGRDQPARVARDEVLFPPGAVRRVGGGSEERGAQKLYSLMDKAHKARKKSARGKDTKLRRGLA